MGKETYCILKLYGDKGSQLILVFFFWWKFILKVFSIFGGKGVEYGPWAGAANLPKLKTATFLHVICIHMFIDI